MSEIERLKHEERIKRGAEAVERHIRIVEVLREMLGAAYDEFKIKIHDNGSGWATLWCPGHRPIYAMTVSRKFASANHPNLIQYERLVDVLLATEKPSLRRWFTGT